MQQGTDRKASPAAARVSPRPSSSPAGGRPQQAANASSSNPNPTPLRTGSSKRVDAVQQRPVGSTPQQGRPATAGPQPSQQPFHHRNSLPSNSHNIIIDDGSSQRLPAPNRIASPSAALAAAVAANGTNNNNSISNAQGNNRLAPTANGADGAPNHYAVGGIFVDDSSVGKPRTASAQHQPHNQQNTAGLAAILGRMASAGGEAEGGGQSSSYPQPAEGPLNLRKAPAVPQRSGGQQPFEEGAGVGADAAGRVPAGGVSPHRMAPAANGISSHLPIAATSINSAAANPNSSANANGEYAYASSPAFASPTAFAGSDASPSGFVMNMQQQQNQQQPQQQQQGIGFKTGPNGGIIPQQQQQQGPPSARGDRRKSPSSILRSLSNTRQRPEGEAAEPEADHPLVNAAASSAQQQQAPAAASPAPAAAAAAAPSPSAAAAVAGPSPPPPPNNNNADAKPNNADNNNNNPAAGGGGGAQHNTKVQIGMMIRRWIVLSRIGAGSFGETFCAAEMHESFSIEEYHRLVAQVKRRHAPQSRANGLTNTTASAGGADIEDDESSPQHANGGPSPSDAAAGGGAAAGGQQINGGDGGAGPSSSKQVADEDEEDTTEAASSAATARRISLEVLALLPPHMRPIREVCIKVEQDCKNVLRLEVQSIRKCQECPQVVRIINSGHIDQPLSVNYLVMERLGPNLADLRRTTANNVFDVYTSLRIGISCLKVIRSVHDLGLTHRDIKPSNFVVGLGPVRSKICYLIDFGLARRFRRSNGQIRPPRENTGFRGTNRYASIQSHRHCELGRVDDLWSLLFMLVEMVTGSLPWRRFKEKEQIGECKIATVNETLVQEMPREFTAFIQHLQSLSYESEPNYDLLIGLLEAAIIRRNYQPDRPLGWERTAAAMLELDATPEGFTTRPIPLPLAIRPVLTLQMQQSVSVRRPTQEEGGEEGGGGGGEGGSPMIAAAAPLIGSGGGGGGPQQNAAVSEAAARANQQAALRQQQRFEIEDDMGPDADGGAPAAPPSASVAAASSPSQQQQQQRSPQLGGVASPTNVVLSGLGAAPSSSDQNRISPQPDAAAAAGANANANISLSGGGGILCGAIEDSQPPSASKGGAAVGSPSPVRQQQQQQPDLDDKEEGGAFAAAVDNGGSGAADGGATSAAGVGLNPLQRKTPLPALTIATTTPKGTVDGHGEDGGAAAQGGSPSLGAANANGGGRSRTSSGKPTPLTRGGAGGEREDGGGGNDSGAAGYSSPEASARREAQQQQHQQQLQQSGGKGFASQNNNGFNSSNDEGAQPIGGSPSVADAAEEAAFGGGAGMMDEDIELSPLRAGTGGSAGAGSPSTTNNYSSVAANATAAAASAAAPQQGSKSAMGGGANAFNRQHSDPADDGNAPEVFNPHAARGGNTKTAGGDNPRNRNPSTNEEGSAVAGAVPPAAAAATSASAAQPNANATSNQTDGAAAAATGGGDKDKSKEKDKTSRKGKRGGGSDAATDGTGCCGGCHVM